MGKILLQSVFHNNAECDILISGTTFSSVGKQLSPQDRDGAEIIDCKGMAIFPAFYNAHTHAAMTLMRGYADDKPLFEWLNNYVWPLEAKLNADDIEIGSRLAVLEMIRTGTVFFADMYWHRERTMKVVEEMGIRAAIGVTISDKLTSPEGLEENFKFLKQHTGESERIQLVVMPHSIYTVSENCFKRSVEIAQKENYLLHTHLSETQQEVADCENDYGCSPVELMQRFGTLNSRFIAAHCVHLNENEKKLFAKSGASIVVNPCSNLKLGSGIPDIAGFHTHGISVALGTDGASSNNNLDMHEEMKIAALIGQLQAHNNGNVFPKETVLSLATEAGAKAYGIHAGKIAEGYLADCILVNKNDVQFTPCHDIVSNWIYSANTNTIDSVICNGKFVMKNRHIDGEDDILKEAQQRVKQILTR